MIAIATDKGALIRAIPDGEFAASVQGVIYGFHQLFGFISEDSLSQRLGTRKRHGLKNEGKHWLCRFQVGRQEKEGVTLKPLEGCQAEALPASAGQGWKLTTPVGQFVLSDTAVLDAGRYGEDEKEEKDNTWKYALLLMFFVVTLGVVLPQKKNDFIPETLPEPVTVKVVQEKQRAMPVPTPAAVEQKKLPSKVANTKTKGGAMVAQNLGFLSLLGKKDLKKAMGGMPTALKDASAGAGEGKEGSGGQLLVGLGAGVKRTTVGNSGVAGLGGIGTKGAGGGAGGYGNSLVGSGGMGNALNGIGDGRSIAAQALSRDIELEGGLDRSVIQATIAKYLSQVRACYEQGLRKNPGLTGLVSMAFEIGGAGDLNFAKVSRSSLGNSDVEQCISKQMLGWKFPKPVGGVNVKVTYPFLLRPVNT